MSIRDFLKKQFIDVIHWTEPADGILAYRFPMPDMEIQNGGKLSDPRRFHTKVGGTRELCPVADLEGQLRNTIVGRMSDDFANSNVQFLDMAANQVALGQKSAELLKPMCTDLRLTLDTFVAQNV